MPSAAASCSSSSATLSSLAYGGWNTWGSDMTPSRVRKVEEHNMVVPSARPGDRHRSPGRFGRFPGRSGAARRSLDGVTDVAGERGEAGERPTKYELVPIGPDGAEVPEQEDPGGDGGDGGRTTPVGRRIVLGMLGIGALGVVVGDRAQGGLERALRPVAENDPTGLTEFVPSTGRFRIYSVTPTMPSRTTAEWRLAVDGLVDRPLDISYDALLAREQAEVTYDFQCVTGWRVPEVPWVGVRVADLLDEAGVQDGATHLRIWSFDGAYTESLTLDQARRDDVLVAHRMLDAPVTREHGGPVRLFVAPMYGYKSLKWLERIEVVDTLHPGYWEQRGYDVDAWVGESNGRGDEPTA
jgi:DMSO/TMAO reductase YedYZ molybdopterin-dependent catalytic subunit